MKKAKGEYAIQTVVNAMRLLEAFRDEEELGVTEISRRLALHKNNVFRLLATLEQQGYIEQCTRNERYRLGVRSLELGQSFSRSRTLLRCARGVLEDLAAGSRESAHLAVLRDFEVVHLKGEQTPRPIMSGLRVGRRLPAHCTALGKILLACAPEDTRLRFGREASAAGLGARTPATIVDLDKLMDHLRGVAVQGFALDLAECEDGLCCAAAPVLDMDGELVAALSVSGPSYRLDEGRLLSDLAPRVVQAAERLSRDLGYAS